MVEHNLVHQYGHWQLCHFVSTTKNGLTLWSEFTRGVHHKKWVNSLVRFRSLPFWVYS